MAEDVSAFGQHRKFPPHARITSGTRVAPDQLNEESNFAKQVRFFARAGKPAPGTEYKVISLHLSDIDLQWNLYSGDTFRIKASVSWIEVGQGLFNNRPDLHDGVILLLRPEFFSFFFSYLNLVAPVRFK